MGKSAAFTTTVLVAWVLSLVALTATAEVASPAPAPAPAPEFLNLTDLLELAGPFKSFLGLLESTDLLKSVQAQANDTLHGVTIFAPSDPAFASLKASALANLTADQKKALVLSHVISKFYTLQDFQNFSNPATTMASGKYNLNITSKSGAVSLSTGHVTAPITSTVHVTYPVAVYTVSKVLLPQDILVAAAPSPSPSPSPANADDAPPTTSPQASADAPSANANANAPGESTASGASIYKPMLLLMLVGAGSLMLLL